VRLTCQRAKVLRGNELQPAHLALLFLLQKA
jgi:hypothetical protein